ncbi:protein-L-isoaspartate(D-aspartate) O-methyltransferase [Streptomyces pini]|uniref:Protein-L-isoaspartate O-methyltransferase n=1 Tax=Streptomyces pini TaxID=1520580 RepID=A0A1I3YWU9_9ACTN|nr:protein-L-isoaspartate(D-aspartate) O-methyltransferase [Streptomyces pini]SFK36344.1 Protein-L-isoaspartate O-methyltransferase [Streptomyces pini]
MSYPDTETAKALRTALTQQLADDGYIRSPEWQSAVAETPRHIFVPVFYRQVRGKWEPVTAYDAGYFDAVYSDTSLTTQVTDGRPTSSSSQPSLMVQMLEGLGVEDGDKVGEVATGTGYNGGLICHRVGYKNFFTMEVDSELTRLAKARLGEVGYYPTVWAGDARNGFPAGVELDRLVVTCGFDVFPYPLARNVRSGGVIVCPLGWGNARLVVGKDGTLEGNFLAGGSYFMKVRGEGGTGSIPYPGEPASPTERRSALGLAELGEEGFRFVQSLVLPGIGDANEVDDEGNTIGYRMWGLDGSWAHVEGSTVRQSGPRRLWDAVEEAHTWFESHGRPARERFGVTIAPDGQRFWLDEPHRSVPVPVDDTRSV